MPEEVPLVASVMMSINGEGKVRRNRSVLGIAVGILTIPLAANLNRGVALLAPASIPLAFGVALLMGMLFGLYPAVRASRLDPIEALRYE